MGFEDSEDVESSDGKLKNDDYFYQLEHFDFEDFQDQDIQLYSYPDEQGQGFNAPSYQYETTYNSEGLKTIRLTNNLKNQGESKEKRAAKPQKNALLTQSRSQSLTCKEDAERLTGLYPELAMLRGEPSCLAPKQQRKRESSLMECHSQKNQNFPTNESTTENNLSGDSQLICQEILSMASPISNPAVVQQHRHALSRAEDPEKRRGEQALHECSEESLEESRAVFQREQDLYPELNDENKLLYMNLLRTEEEYETNFDYFPVQREISPLMRMILFDWMMEVCMEFMLKRETYMQAIMYVDRYLSLQKRLISKKDLQLIGVTAMNVSSKIEEVYPPRIEDFIKSTDDAYSHSQMNQMEISMCQVRKKRKIN